MDWTLDDWTEQIDIIKFYCFCFTDRVESEESEALFFSHFVSPGTLSSCKCVWIVRMSWVSFCISTASVSPLGKCLALSSQHCHTVTLDDNC